MSDHHDRKEPCTVINVYCDKEKDHHHKNCDCPFGVNAEYAMVYSNLPQDLTASPGLGLAGQSPLFENAGPATAGIDISQASISGEIKVNKAGVYNIDSGVCGTLNPLSSPLNVWALSVFVNGAIVPGSTNANMTLSPEQRANDVSSDVYVHLAAGDIVKLANMSTNLLSLTAPILGINTLPNSVYLKLSLLKAD